MSVTCPTSLIRIFHKNLQSCKVRNNLNISYADGMTKYEMEFHGYWTILSWKVTRNYNWLLNVGILSWNKGDREFASKVAPPLQ